MSQRPVFVINPNSSATVTAAIEGSVAPWRGPGGIDFQCVTMNDGPAGVVTQGDADRAGLLVARFVTDRRDSAAGFVIACFSDPGIRAAREATQLPVVGVGEAGLLAAMAAGHRVGVVAISSQAIPRHMHYWRALGLDGRVAAERAIDLPVADSGNASIALTAMIAAARALRDQDRADVILLGCAGMGSLRAAVQEAVGLPVIDPCQAGAALMSLSVLAERSRP
jgi:Asp/Glu/hydantoin racemase